MTHRVLLKANRKLFSERTHLDKAIWILGRIVLFNGQHVAAKQSRLLRWLFKVIIWTSSHKLDHFLVFNVKMKKWFVFVSGKAQQQQLWERESHGGRGGGNKPSFSSISSLSSEALYPGFDAEIKSYYFRLAGVEMQCMDRHTTYGKKTTKAQPVIRWINNTFVGTGTRMPRYTELFLLYEHK